MTTHWRHLLRRALANVRAAIDLASIMVGVLVIGLISGVIAATVFAVIPWAQDRVAISSLDSVKTAEGVAKTKDGTYLNSSGLTSAGYLPPSDTLAVLTNTAGTCWVAASASGSGKTFYLTSKGGNPVDDTAGVPDTTWCVSAHTLLASPVVNLARNPSFETTSGGQTPVMTNLVKNPSAVPGGSPYAGWGGSGGGTGVTSYVPASWASKNSAAQHRWTTGVTNDSGNIHWTFNPYGTPVLEPNTTYTALWTTVSSKDQAFAVQITNWAIPSGTINSGTGTVVRKSPTTHAAAGEPVQQFATFTTGPNTVGVEMFSRVHNSEGTPWAAGDFVQMADVITVKGTHDPDILEEQFFTGDTTADGDFQYAWTGAPNDSFSVRTGAVVTGASTHAAANRVAVQSQVWKKSGSKSVRITPNTGDPTGANVDSFAELDGQLPATLKPNTTYTLLGTLHLTKPQTGGAAHARGFRVNVGGEALPLNYLTTASNTAGDHEVRGTFTTGVGGAVSIIRIHNGGPQSLGNADVWWDDFLMTEGTYTGPYFDGDSANGTWDGTPHASTSTGYVRTR